MINIPLFVSKKAPHIVIPALNPAADEGATAAGGGPKLQVLRPWMPEHVRPPTAWRNLLSSLLNMQEAQRIYAVLPKSKNKLKVLYCFLLGQCWLNVTYYAPPLVGGGIKR